MIPFLTELALKAKGQKLTTIELTQENEVDPDDPDFGRIHQLVDEALHPATATPSP
jgi:hypothetical protein